MKIAFGISAYKDPTHLNRLISSLSNNDTEFYIHVDKKIDIKPFKLAVNQYSNCKFIKERHNIQWGSWNQVKYQLSFLKEMLNSNNRPERIFIISGQDYPIWSNKKIKEYSQKFPEKIWMCGLNMRGLDPSSMKVRFLKIPHYFRDTNFYSHTLWRYITGFQRHLFLKLLPNLRDDFIIINNKKWDIWQSSGYFSCNRSVANYIVETINNYPQIIKYFKYSFVPEEFTIPTIIFNSKFGKYAYVYKNEQYEGLLSLAMLHQFDYGKEIKIYTENDYNKIIKSNKVFCRKVKTGISDKLLEMIDVFRKKV